MSSGIINTIKEASLNAWKSTKPTEISFGEVISTEPLKIKVSSLLTLGKKQCTLNGTVSQGSKVPILRVQGGQKYVVIGDRTVTEVVETGDSGGSTGSGSSSGGWVYPLSRQATLRSGYGYRIHPISHTRKLHTGVDLACPKNTGVLAAKGGTVEVAWSTGGYGKTIVINHGGGFKSRYAHLNSYNVKKGQKVTTGQLIGRVDSTGSSTGHHLHFEIIKNGSTVNPFKYIPSKK